MIVMLWGRIEGSEICYALQSYVYLPLPLRTVLIVSFLPQVLRSNSHVLTYEPCLSEPYFIIFMSNLIYSSVFIQLSIAFVTYRLKFVGQYL